MNAWRLSLIYLAMAALSLWQVTVIPESPMYAVVGATLAPAVISLLFAALCVIYAVCAFKGQAPDTEQEESETALPGARARFGYFFGGCLLFVALVKPLGFLIAGTVAGLGIARSFDAGLNAKSLLICGLITLAFWVLFAVLLSVDIGPLIAGVA